MQSLFWFAPTQSRPLPTMADDTEPVPVASVERAEHAAKTVRTTEHVIVRAGERGNRRPVIGVGDMEATVCKAAATQRIGHFEAGDGAGARREHDRVNHSCTGR